MQAAQYFAQPQSVPTTAGNCRFTARHRATQVTCECLLDTLRDLNYTVVVLGMENTHGLPAW